MKTVTIAGAGIIGLASAWRLAQRGWRVMVFDARGAAGESSWAGAGMLAPGGEIDSNTSLAKMAVRSLGMYPEFVRELEEESRVAVEYRRCGGIEVAMDDAGLEGLTRKSARQAAIGIASEPCRYRDWEARFYPDDAIVDPRTVNAALLKVCRQRGIVIHEHEPVTAVLANGSGVRTAQGEYLSDQVLIAAGAWSSTLLPGLPRVFPVRGHLVRFDMEPRLLTTIVRSGHTYLLQRESGALIAGSSTEDAGFDRTLDAAIAGDIHQRAAKLLPALARVAPTECWNGLRPATDSGPVLGQFGETAIWTAYGHFRNGILLAPDTAQTIADRLETA
jgi:glycine oxidase